MKRLFIIALVLTTVSASSQVSVTPSAGAPAEVVTPGSAVAPRTTSSNPSLAPSSAIPRTQQRMETNSGTSLPSQTAPVTPSAGAGPQPGPANPSGRGIGFGSGSQGTGFGAPVGVGGSAP